MSSYLITGPKATLGADAAHDVVFNAAASRAAEAVLVQFSTDYVFSGGGDL